MRTLSGVSIWTTGSFPRAFPEAEAASAVDDLGALDPEGRDHSSHADRLIHADGIGFTHRRRRKGAWDTKFVLAATKSGEGRTIFRIGSTCWARG